MEEPKILYRYPIQSLGTTQKYIEIVECPECKYQYPREVSTGCFHCRVHPSYCPKCNYPYSKLRKKNKEEDNPSRRKKNE